MGNCEIEREREREREREEERDTEMIASEYKCVRL
jgi:hypothetical protein